MAKLKSDILNAMCKTPQVEFYGVLGDDIHGMAEETTKVALSYIEQAYEAGYNAAYEEKEVLQTYLQIKNEWFKKNVIE